MALPILETFAEHGYHLFHTPEAVYADFHAAGIFRRSGIDVASQASRLVQREALFDVALSHGLSSEIAIYVLAHDAKDTFLLQEPVAVQTWVKSHVEKTRANIMEELDSASKLTASVRRLRGLKHVLQALLNRLEEGKQAALPKQIFLDESPWTENDGSALLTALLDDLLACERLAGFTLWLLHRFHDSSLRLTKPSPVLDAILASACLSDLAPLPPAIDALVGHLEAADALTAGALLLFLALDQSTKHKQYATLGDMRALAVDAAAALQLPHLHAMHVLALWCIDHDRFLPAACDLLLQSPPECMDAPVLAALLAALRLHPDLAWRVYSSFPVALDDASLLLAVLDVVLALDQWALGWMLARQHPAHVAAAAPKLIAYHRAHGNVRDVLLKMTWTDGEMAAWQAKLPADDLVMLHLVRSDYKQATAAADKAPPASADVQLMLQTVVPAATDVAIPLDGGVVASSSPPPAKEQAEKADAVPATGAMAWPKPTKDQYAHFFHKPPNLTLPKTTTTTAVGPTSLSLTLKKLPTVATSPRAANPASDIAGTSLDPETTSRLPYQWLTTDLTPGPRSASKVAQLKKHAATFEEPLELNPTAFFDPSNPFSTPLRTNLPKEAQTMPARRNPIREARKKY
ncbi:Aste57867_8698 [Aphanomyces stellatus]|uniref:Aste57867_8698 protein n=1 Tax=Aphanomyces stellatus TaxID=120398 RepID=A0A485KLB6_9STRA|nr:hypothetical protein As57867_008664 [Aphanomyces stellatus]VFT85584.1 Aste57867_8698 [Aphanomyces stellatus]